MRREAGMRSRHIPVELGPGQYSRWFVVITAVFVTTLIVSNIVAVKIVDVWGLYVPAGTVTVFPLAYIFCDFFSELFW